MEPLATARDGRSRVTAADVMIAVVAVALLYLARQVLEPIALAVLLSFVLTPAVVRLHRWGLGQVPSVMMVVLLAFLIVGGVAGVIGTQLTQLAGELPRYQTTLVQKVQSLKSAATGGSLVRSIGTMLQGLNSEIAKPPTSAPSTGLPAASATPSTLTTEGARPDGAAQEPVPVVVRQAEPRPLQVITDLLGPLVEPIGMAGIVIVFVIFILLQRQDLRDRLIWIAGSRDLRRASVAIDDAAERLSRYFLTQLAINTAYGITVGAALWLIGIPNPVLWGVLSMLLRFVPYVGAIIATALPLGVAAAVDPGWSKVFWTAGLYFVVEMVVSQAVEPLLYGRSTGLSALAVVIAATFWTWLWGPIGLVLSTPLTLLIVVIGQHVERLAFLAVLLGDRPALTPAQSFFQRVMSGDADEAAEQGDRFLKDQPLINYYDQIVLPGLRLAQVEANRGALDAEDLRRLAATVEEVVDNFAPGEVGEHAAADKSSEEGSVAAPESAVTAVQLRPEWHAETPILCVAGRSPLDEAAAAIFRQLLASKGISVRVASFGSASSSQVFKLSTEGTALICLSYMAVDGSPTHTRFLVRRLRRRAPGVKILGGFWTVQEDNLSLDKVQAETGVDLVATTLHQAVDICLREAALPAGEQEPQPAQRPRAIA